MDDIPGQAQLDGIAPTAVVRLTHYLNPDGTLSHLEIESRAPDGALVAYETFPASAVLDDGFRAIQARSRFTEVVRQAARRLANS